MRHKRNPKLFLIKQQQKLIASRLMHISLRVDDYVYKHIPMPVKDAAMFIKEVIGYRDKCFEDKRSLQVIEKLVRCMKGIIAEQHDVQPDLSSLKTDENTPSVVEHLTQFTQETVVNKISRKPKRDTEVDKRTDTHERVEYNEKEIIHLCEDFNKNNMEYQIENVNQEERHSNEHLQRAISNLTIRGEDDPLSNTQVNVEDCSQSILNDFDCFKHIDQGEGVSINKIVHSQDFEEVGQPVTIIAKKSNTRQVSNLYPTYIGKPRNMTKHSNTANNASNVHNETASSIENNKNIDKEKRQRKRSRKINQKCDIVNVQENKPISPIKKKPNKNKFKKQNVVKKIAPEKKLKTSMKLYKHAILETLQPNGLYRSDENFNQQTRDKTLDESSHVSLKTPAVNTVYNKDVANDLSWIENIRYVREFAVEEIIPAYFEDSFWDTYTLPKDWNNDDFLYT